MSLALIAALPFAGALLPGLMIRAGRDVCAIATGCVTGLALLLVLLHAPAVLGGAVIETRFDWVPALGLQMSLRLDGLGLLFAGLILGIGLLIVLYARFYLDSGDPAGLFYTYLLLFQGAMLGIVLSGNVLLLLIFWELTSLASFLLIGYWNHKPEARQGARMALIVTGGGGLALTAGLLLLGQIAGSYELDAILAQRDTVQASPLYLPALVLILLGCFTKSAQVPFHFWLPHAMAAPTPVSAYLHSATMVKAGLFLLARLWPVLAGTEAWFHLVTATGLVTMVFGALIAIFRDDLKALLAWSTISHLGFVTMLLGFGTQAAAAAALFHILNHAVIKATLFMVAGIVDHVTSTRDIARLGGLRRLMPVTAAIATVAALSMAGVPLLNGFVSKEMMLAEAVRTPFAGNPWLVPALATVGAVLSVVYALRFVMRVFFGALRYGTVAPPHDPGVGLWAAPAMLAALVVAVGVAPAALAGGLIAAAAVAVSGSAGEPVALWHGATPALALGLGALAGGAVLLAVRDRLARGWDAVPLWHAKRLFDAAAGAVVGAAQRRTSVGASPARVVALLVLAAAVLAGAAFATGGHLTGVRIATPLPLLAALGTGIVLAAAAVAALRHRDRLAAVIAVAVAGLMLSAGFVYLSAPDLALTQITVEVVTAVLLLLALNFLPKTTPREPARRGRNRAAALLALLAGGGVAALSWAILMRNPAQPGIAPWMIANAYAEGGGTNVVNVIIVDFRAFDTYGEVVVLGIAALLIHALTETLLNGPANRRLRRWTRDQIAAGVRDAGDRHPLMMVVVTRALLPFATMVGVYLFWRGHYQPGGGFVAGLVVAIALVVQYMASGFAWTAARQKIRYHGLIGAGVGIAGLTGIGAWFSGTPFLTSAFGTLPLPLVGPLPLATAMAFDLGVFLTVLGAVMLALSSVSRLAIRAGETVNAGPMDIDLSAVPPALTVEAR